MLQSRIQKQIPERLSHYTNLEALKSILSDQDGKGICFRAFSNRCKNDDQEIRMGEYMLKRVREVLPTSASLLNQFGGYEDSGSISFMEGEVNQHMLKEYGCYRLEFDLRGIGVGLLARGLIDCEYVPESELEEFADEYKLNKAIFPGIQGGPLMHIIAGKAVALGECLKPEFKAYAKQIVANAQALAKELLAQGFALVSGGTDNHLMLVDVSVLGLTGKAVEQALDKAGISVNKNAIPFDKQKPMVTSGIRIGTPSVTTRGMKEAEMVQIARFIKKACDNIDNDAALAALRDEVYAFTAKFPMYK